MSDTIRNIEIRNALIDNYNNYAQGLDSKNWDMVRNCFTDEIMIDYGEISAPSGDPSVPRRTEDWLVHLRTVINKFDITRHTITNHRVIISDDEISCRAYLTADHVKFADPAMPTIADGEIATVVGEYYNHYTEIDGAWKICRSELVVHWSQGNMGLFI